MLKVECRSHKFEDDNLKTTLHGFLFLEDNKIKLRPDPSDLDRNTNFLQSFIDDQTPKEKKLMKENPGKWLLSLPHRCRGTYFSLDVVED